MKYLKSYKLFETISNNRVDYYISLFKDRVINTDISKSFETLIVEINGESCLRIRQTLPAQITSYYVYEYSDTESMFIDITETNDEGYPKKSKELYSILYYSYLVTQHFISEVGKSLFKLHEYLLRCDLLERLEEFDVVKDYDIDFISLNHLFDFYKISYDEEYWMNKFKQIKISANKTVLDEVK